MAKLTQILIHGAKLVKVNGSYDQAFDIATEFAQKSGYYLRNTGINPMMTEGKKTVAFEIAADNNFDPIDNIFVSVGDGCIIGSVYKGFYELNKTRVIDWMPKIYGIQADGANPIYRAFENNKKDIDSQGADTIADSISVGEPRDYQKALRAVRKSGGKYISVSDKEIMDGQKKLAMEEGIYSEPAASAAYAGYLKESVKGKTVVLVTGNGLKDIKATIDTFDFHFMEIEPKGYDIEEIIRGIQ